MFERYTEKARRSIFFARYEASAYGSSCIESEHLLLGLMREDRPLLQRCSSANVDAIRKEIENLVPPRTDSVSTTVDLPLSTPLKRALAYGAEEAERLNHLHLGTGHLLLGLLREKDSIVPKLLDRYGISREIVLREIAQPFINRETPNRETPSDPAFAALSAMVGKREEDEVRRAGKGRYTRSRLEGGAEVSETHHFLDGHEIVVIERLRLSDDGKTLSYMQEVNGPGKSSEHTIDFDVS